MFTVAELREAFPDYEFNPQSWVQSGNDFWKRIFIIYKGNNCTLGRINLKKRDEVAALYNIKWYKKSEYEYGEGDDIFYQIYRFESDGVLIPFEAEKWIAQAKTLRKNHIQKIQDQRDANPKYNKLGERVYRKKLSSEWMGCFRKIVAEEMSRKI